MSRHRLVSCALGLLLLAAGGLKAQGLAADPVGRMGIFSTPELQLAVIEFELFLAIWLLWGKQPLGSWLVAVGTFFCFAVVSFYQGSVGQSSCGCFGRLSISPWYAFGLDVLVLGSLLFGRPDLIPLWENPRQGLRSVAAPVGYGLAGMALVGGLLLTSATIGFGSVPAALAYFRGERVSIEPRLVEITEGTKGESRRASVTITNWTDKPIHLFGGTQDCSCTVVGDLPLTVPAMESRSVAVKLYLSGKPGIFTRKAGFLVDDEGFKKITFFITGRILSDSGVAVGGR